MAGINPIKNLKALFSDRVLLETVPTNGKRKFDSENNDSKSNYCNNSGNKSDNNNEQKYNYNDNKSDDKNNSNKYNKNFYNDNND